MAQEQQDVETLKRRGRRRLVGAIALVLLALIVLPMVCDGEPRNTLPAVSVRIPSESDAPPFAPKPPPKPTVKPQASGEFVIPVGAFANAEAVTAKLAGAQLPYYTEAVKGKLTRVRAGPFPSKEAADHAVETLKALGFKPGMVTTKAG